MKDHTVLSTKFVTATLGPKFQTSSFHHIESWSFYCYINEVFLFQRCAPGRRFTVIFETQKSTYKVENVIDSNDKSLFDI